MRFSGRRRQVLQQVRRRRLDGAPGPRLCPPPLPPSPAPHCAVPGLSCATSAAPSQGSSVLVKVLVAFLVFILLVVLAVTGSCVYIGYRAKKKADEIQQAYKTNDLNKLAGALGVGSSKQERRFLERIVRIFRQRHRQLRRRFLFPRGRHPPAEANPGAEYPLRPGLTVVTAIAQFGGDYESIKQIQQVTATGSEPFLPRRQRTQSAGGHAETERRPGPEIRRLGSWRTHGPRRGSANRARLHAMVRSQSTASHARQHCDQRFAGGV